MNREMTRTLAISRGGGRIDWQGAQEDFLGQQKCSHFDKHGGYIGIYIFQNSNCKLGIQTSPGT